MDISLEGRLNVDLQRLDSGIMSVKKCKLSLFPPKYFGVNNDEDVIFNRDEFPHLSVGDIIEVHHPENDNSIHRPRLLLMVGPKSIYPDNQLQKPPNKETIYIEKSIADSFFLPNFKDVLVRGVDPEQVALDSIELTFKDQYMGRSEMWRIKNHLVGNCVFLNKKIDIAQGTIRCQVYEMWAQGDRVACGVVTSDTKVVFRSPTAMIYLFIQMSSEMWDFDKFGDLYFEKAVDGFLSDMFDKWSMYGSSHEVTIVLFSRCFYDATDHSQFPEKMQDCLQAGYSGKYYEDFYRVVVQNERFENWKPVLLDLRKIFVDYKSSILNHHKTGDPEKDKLIPSATLSTAAQGNFLEVLNMSLNTFENHYLNRNLDRTGQQSIVITPGLGLFEVDRELMLITGQRIIDSGVGSDLICVGEQPLHAVPLFQLYNKDDVAGGAGDDFSMPHWINLSFYTKPHRVGGRSQTFVPRVKLPPDVERFLPDTDDALTNDYYPRGAPLPLPDLEYAKDPHKFYEDYDAKIFTLPHMNKRPNRGSSTAGILRTTTGELLTNSFGSANLRRKMSDPEARISRGDSFFNPEKPSERSVGIPKNPSCLTLEEGIYSSSAGNLMTTPMAFNLPTQELNEDQDGTNFVDVSIMGSIDNSFDHQAIKKYLLRPGRALINPFDPSHTEVRITSNRRRWTHIFPKSSKSGNEMTSSKYLDTTEDVLTQIGTSGIQNGNIAEEVEGLLRHEDFHEETFTPLTTGVDWKSLTIPASLPITTDYFPDRKTLVNDYLVNEYDLTPGEIWHDTQHSPLEKLPLTNEEVFHELISQRLAQGFQLITALNDGGSFSKTPSNGAVIPRPSDIETSVWVSIGCIFHRLTLSADKKQIKVTCYRPRRPHPSVAVHYRYRFAAPDNDDYEVSWVEFKTEQLENFNWNRMDFYVCTHGDKEFVLTESLKYWRFRLYAVPMCQFQPYTKKILEGSPAQHGDIYTIRLSDEQADLSEKFLRFVEACLNRLKRPQPVLPRKITASSSGISDRPRAYTSAGGHLPKLRTEGIAPRSSLGGGALTPLLSPPPRDVLLSTSNASDGSSSYESPIAFPPTISSEAQLTPSSSETTLKMTSTFNEILDAMKSTTQSGGLTFFNQVPGLPPFTFIAYEAVTWLLNRVEDVTRVEAAKKILQNMIDKKYICHASGNPNIPFINGHFFYSIVLNTPERDWSVYNGDVESFRNDWIEIEVEAERFLPKCSQSLSSQHNDIQVPEFLDRTMDRFYERRNTLKKISSGPFYNFVTIDIDQNAKSERKEWGHLKYQPRYDAQSAFELTLQWSVATGPIITDLIHGWARKSQQSGFSLIPVPHDPFALPITKNSDPVRGPIFVELNTECLMENKSFLFEKFPESSWEDRMLLFREEIALRFGFVSCITDRSIRRSSSSLFSTDHQYIHCTGNMFLLIPTQVQLQTGIQGLKVKPSTTGTELTINRGTNLNQDLQQQSQQPQQQQQPTEQRKHSKVNRHLTDAKPAYVHSETGFLWSWNFMISKRWKQISNTGATGDILFMDKMLADFRAFCRNDDNRLKIFWDECWAKKRAHDCHIESLEEE